MKVRFFTARTAFAPYRPETTPLGAVVFHRTPPVHVPSPSHADRHVNDNVSTDYVLRQAGFLRSSSPRVGPERHRALASTARARARRRRRQNLE